MKNFQPSEQAIAGLLAKYTARQLAIAYLRAQHRVRQMDLASKTDADVDAALASLRAGGSFDDITRSLDRATRRFGREF